MIAEILIDFRQFYDNQNQKNDFQFEYGKDWDIFYIISENLTEQSLIQEALKIHNSSDLPEAFLKVDKIQNHSFSFFAWQDLKLGILIRIFTPVHYPQRFNLMNSTKITLKSPYRAKYNEKKIFGFIIQNDETIDLPINILPLDDQYQKYPQYLINYKKDAYEYFKNLAKTDLKSNPSQILNQLFWNGKQQISMPYIPYLSNCREFGSQGILYTIVENEELCDLIPVEKTVPIRPFVFGDKPISDQCENIKFDCIFDEQLNRDPEYENWFQTKQDDTIFYITQYATDFLKSQLDSKDTYFNEADIIKVKAGNNLQNGYLPKVVQFDIQYYQTSNTEKQIIQAFMLFLNQVQPNNDQVQDDSPFEYTLVFNYKSMTQSELIIAFTLGWYVYLVLYLIIGILMVFNVFVFVLYHYIFSRRRPRPKIKFIQCIKPFYTQAFIGVYLTLFPVGFILILNGIFMSGSIFDLNTSFFNCEETESESKIEFYKYQYKQNGLKIDSENFIKIKKGRSNLAMIVIGIYIMYYMIILLIPHKKGKIDELMGNISLDNNIWYKTIWRRFYYFFFTIIIIIIMSVIIQFSLSNNFSENIWYFLVIIKIIGMVFECIGEYLLQDNILISIINTSFDCTLNMATLGANDFFDFLFSYFVEIGIQMIERAYVSIIRDQFSEFLEVKYDQFQKYVNTYLQL
ncbi:hypothetical protein IMG5_197430, partial [Ichthyophthirius multifiliis]